MYTHRGGTVAAATVPSHYPADQHSLYYRSSARGGSADGSRVLRFLAAIATEANRAVLRRAMFSWALWPKRQRSLRSAVQLLQRRVRLSSSLRIARQYFGPWRRSAVASLRWAGLYTLAEALERRSTYPAIARILAGWRRHAELRRELRDIAGHLHRCNLLLLARQFFVAWRRGRRRRSQRGAMAASRTERARELATRYLLDWQKRALRQQLLRRLTQRTTTALALRFFAQWRTNAHLGARLVAMASDSHWEVARRAFQRWRRCHERAAATQRLESDCAHRLLSPLFREWAWQAQLSLLRYHRHVALSGLPVDLDAFHIEAHQ